MSAGSGYRCDQSKDDQLPGMRGRERSREHELHARLQAIQIVDQVQEPSMQTLIQDNVQRYVDARDIPNVLAALCVNQSTESVSVSGCTTTTYVDSIVR